MCGIAPVGTIPTGAAPASAPTGVAFTASITEAADTLGGAFASDVALAAGITEAADTLAGTIASGAPASLVFAPTGIAPTGALAPAATGGGGGGVAITGNTSEVADSLTGASAVGVVVASGGSIPEAADTLSGAVATGGGSGAATAGFSAPLGVVPVGVLPIADDGICDFSGSPVEAADTCSGTFTNGGGMTAAANITEQADTLTGSAAVTSPGTTVTLTASITEVADAAESALVEAADSGSGTIVTGATIDANITEAADTAPHLGEAPDTSSSTIAVDAVTDSSINEAADTLTSATNVTSGGTVLFSASITEVPDAAESALVEAADSGSGTVVASVVTDSSITDVGDSLSSLSSVISGGVLNASITEAADTLSSSSGISGGPPANVAIDGAPTETGDSTSSTAVVDVVCAASITEAPDGQIAQAAPLPIQGGGGVDGTKTTRKWRDSGRDVVPPTSRKELGRAIYKPEEPEARSIEKRDVDPASTPITDRTPPKAATAPETDVPLVNARAIAATRAVIEKAKATIAEAEHEEDDDEEALALILAHL
ncbi:MAG TPA: hypothetical protein PKV98_04555 [Burkholderiaceae bacterium]|nr:hypothetical protein [Burkholderiaceae bacterium]